jgi:RPA family protein
MESKFMRAVAYKVPLNLLLSGPYIQQEDSPNYIGIDEKKISRVHIMGIVVSYSPENIIIDDGTAKILLRSFEQRFVDIRIGEIILVIGRIGEYNNERYVSPEILRKSSDKWMRIWKEQVISGTVVKQEKSENAHNQDSSLPFEDTLIEYIREQDKGKGVMIELLISHFSGKDCEKAIDTMLREGELFENLPGSVKLLE